MQTFKDFIDTATSILKEDTDVNFPYKGIMFDTRGSDKVIFWFIFAENEKFAMGSYENVSFDEWRKSDKQDVSSEKMKNNIINGLVSGITQMSKRIDANSAIKSAGSDFVKRVDAALRFSPKYSKITNKGITVPARADQF